MPTRSKLGWWSPPSVRYFFWKKGSGLTILYAHAYAHAHANAPEAGDHPLLFSLFFSLCFYLSHENGNVGIERGNKKTFLNVFQRNFSVIYASYRLSFTKIPENW